MRTYFSIILPTFNRARLLPRAVMSVRVQTFSDWELIIVDDGSTDETQNFLNKFSDDLCIRVVTHTHRGLARSRAAGIAAARGTFITFLDSDDAYAPEHLRLRFEFLQAHPEIKLLHGGVEIVGDPFVADKFNPSQKIHLRDCVIGGTFVIDRSVIDQLGGWSIVDYGDDNAFFQKAIAANIPIAIIAAPTYIYNRGEEDSLCNIVEHEGIAAAMKFQNEGGRRK